MSQFENIGGSRSLAGDDGHQAARKLSDEILMVASTATLGLAVAALIVETKGRALPALAEVGEKVGADFLGRAEALVGETIERKGGSLVPDILKPKASALIGDVEDFEVGARPAPQYVQGARPMEAKHLGFIDKWPVEGVRVHGDAVDLYVTKNGHWLELKNFERPLNFPGLSGLPPSPVQPLDLLNTQVRNIRVSPSLNPFSSVSGPGESAEGERAFITLTRGAAHEIKLSGNIKITEFWHR